ncbi:unnamed protein product [Amoebophrya sp. A120]|nr:unnamed protein product [Amoebophrya sp. A120]|eukprot:GSA120T00009129001.1
MTMTSTSSDQRHHPPSLPRKRAEPAAHEDLTADHVGFQVQREHATSTPSEDKARLAPGATDRISLEQAKLLQALLTAELYEELVYPTPPPHWFPEDKTRPIGDVEPSSTEHPAGTTVFSPLTSSSKVENKMPRGTSHKEKTHHPHGDWDHLVEWNEGENSWQIQKPFRTYAAVVGDLNDVHNVQIRCLLCKNARGRPIYFDKWHFESDKHKAHIVDRERVLDIALGLKFGAVQPRLLAESSLLSGGRRSTAAASSKGKKLSASSSKVLGYTSGGKENQFLDLTRPFKYFPPLIILRRWCEKTRTLRPMLHCLLCAQFKDCFQCDEPVTRRLWRLMLTANKNMEDEDRQSEDTERLLETVKHGLNSINSCWRHRNEVYYAYSNEAWDSAHAKKARWKVERMREFVLQSDPVFYRDGKGFPFDQAYFWGDIIDEDDEQGRSGEDDFICIPAVPPATPGLLVSGETEVNSNAGRTPKNGSPQVDIVPREQTDLLNGGRDDALLRKSRARREASMTTEQGSFSSHKKAREREIPGIASSPAAHGFHL